MKQTHILILEDAPIVREGLKSLLDSMRNVHSVSIACLLYTSIPAMGCLPNEWNMTPANGIMSKYPKSEAILDKMPVKTTIKVIDLGGAFTNNALIAARISPLLSATPIPNLSLIHI